MKGVSRLTNSTGQRVISGEQQRNRRKDGVRRSSHGRAISVLVVAGAKRQSISCLRAEPADKVRH